MGGTKHHHIVSKGYLQAFAEEVAGVGGRSNWHRAHLVRTDTIAYGALTEPPTPVGIGSLFARQHFNSFRGPDGMDDRLEHTWGGIESAALPAVRSLLDGDRSAA